MPFVSPWERDIHFARHGHKLGAANAQEYERMADDFMFGNLLPDTRECLRPGVDRLRLGFTTRNFGVACTHPIFVRTFYPVKASVIVGRGGVATYFAYECARVRL
jgi:hypothetical protein